MNLIKKTFYLLVIICSLIGLYFSILGWIRFHEQRVLFFIAIYSCGIGIMVGIFEIVKISKNKYDEFYRIILGVLGGVAIILASAYLIFMINSPLLIKLISIFGILFFSISIIKGVKRINIEQDKIIIVDLDYDNAFEKAKRILKMIRVKAIKDNKNEGIIVAETGLSWKSFGENLLLEFKKLNDNQTQIRILSKSKIRTTMIDFGKNLENIDKFCKGVEEHINTNPQDRV